MARLIPPPTGSGPVDPFEQRVIEHLLKALPADYALMPNFNVREKDGSTCEYDAVILAPHAIYILEAKDWRGRLVGDDTEWVLNATPRRCPMWLVERKAKVLKSHLGALATQVWFEPAFVVPDGTQNYVGGSWKPNVHVLASLPRFLMDGSIKQARDIKASLPAIESRLGGDRQKRLRNRPQRIGSYQVVETLYVDDDMKEFKAKRAFLDDPSLYRVRTWRLSGYESREEREKRENMITRPTEAIARIGRHPNLLPVLEFSKVEDEQLFYEVTEWSDYGTLHGYLKKHAHGELTLRERLEIAAGVASALEAVHAQGIVHRNVSPETILVAFDRTPRLTDFDRAYIEGKRTVFAGTERRTRNPAYVAPELRNATDYDFDTCSDMFSVGVLLYELLVGELPFPDATKPLPDALPKKPSGVRDGVDQKLDELIEKLLLPRDFRSRPTASDALTVLRELLGSSNGPRKPTSNTSRKGNGDSFEAGHVVDGIYRVDKRLGSGAFSEVFKVYHLDQGRFFAMKVLKRAEESDVMLDEFNKISGLLPLHPNIARIAWLGRTAPKEKTPGTPYLLSEFIDGESLAPYCEGKKTLPWPDIQRIGLELLSALGAIHPRLEDIAATAALEGREPDSLSDDERALLERVNNTILHRDIKPDNILLELPQHRAKLIDFNVGTTFGRATGRGGTPRYWAPDRGKPRWLPRHDLFSLGIVLYELVTHRHPFNNDSPDAGAPHDPRDIAPDLHLSDAVSMFLLKSVNPSGDLRFQSAEEMATALRAIPTMRTLGKVPSSNVRAGLAIVPEEQGKADYNPFVTRLLTLYSQARRTNAGTRGLDEIARLTYVRTKLDDELAPRVADGQVRLLIVTGNAGDGKTAFLQQVEKYFEEQGVKVTPLASGNGSEWSRDGLRFETNYDGSQDEKEEKSDDVLARFLSPFGNDVVAGLKGREIRLLAINEGRLLDFLHHGPHATEFAGLAQMVLECLSGEKEPHEGLLLVNLNMRAVAAGGRESIVERQLSAMLQESLWAPCTNCSHREKCPLKHNADTLSDPSSGVAVRDRLRRLFEVVHLRRRAHVTMRDLRSALSWIVLRDTGCEEVGRLLKSTDNDASERLAALYYPDALTGNAGARDRVDDRLVRLLREVDVGAVDDPLLDRRLDHGPLDAVPWMTFEKRSSYANQVVVRLSDDVRSHSDGAGMADAMRERRRRIARWRRWAYYERRDDGWLSMLPYRSVPLLERIVSPTDAAERAAAEATLRNDVIEAVSLSEGMRHADVRRRFLALRVSRVKNPSVRSYRLFPVEDFTIHVPDGGSLARLIEYAPDAVELRAIAGRARMRISLDLLEMLALIRTGYRPSPQDLQGLFVNLQIFRNELLSLPFEKIIATQDDDDLFEISSSVSGSGTIQLALRRYAAPTTGGAAP